MNRKVVESSILHSGNNNWAAYAKIELELEKLESGKGIEIDFDFNKEMCNRDDVKLIEKCTSTQDRIEIFDQLSYDATMFHEGAIFGLKYAYEVLLLENPEEFKASIKVRSIDIKVSVSHDAVAYVATKGLWLLFNFIPKDQIYLDRTKQKFVFPNTKSLVPIGRVAQREAEKYLELGTYTQADLDEYLDFIQKTTLEYHNR